MAEFKITRFRYNWKGNWSNSTVTYYKDDVVFYQGSSWACIRQHISDVFNNAQIFVQGQETNSSPAWVKTTDGRTFLGNWTASGTRYDPGTLVLAGGNVYLCVVSHVSSAQFNSDLSNWELFAVGSNFSNTWTPENRYRVGDVVRYSGYTYQCVLEHTSGIVGAGVDAGNNDTINDSTAETWQVVVENYTFVGLFQPSTNYRLNDLVKYGGSVLKCISAHTSLSGAGSIDNTKFETYLSGFDFESTWDSSTYYAIGDVVKYANILYVANTNNYASAPVIPNQFPISNPLWTAIVKGTQFKGEYISQLAIIYKQGDVVRRGGSLWTSLIDQTSDDSSLAPFDSSNWDLVIPGYNYTGQWVSSKDYNLYDIVYFKGTTYYVNTPHTSTVFDFPGDNGEGFAYWTILLLGDQDAGLVNLGDLLTRNLSRVSLQDGDTEILIGDTSTIGNTAINIGTLNQLLVVESNQESIGYKTWGNIPRVFYVSINGVDDITDINRGINYFTPWRTIRFALEQADDNYNGRTTVFVATGEYEEVLPLILPAGLVVAGEELRSTSIKASVPNAALAVCVPYTMAALTRLRTIFSNLLQQILVVPSPGNTVSQNNSVASVGTTNVLLVDSIWASLIAMINFKINSIGSTPVVTGNNTLTVVQGRLNVVSILENNRSFLIAEAIAYTQSTYPLYAIDLAKDTQDINNFINALIYDIRYPGNYKSVLAGRYYANAVVGSQLEDMCYVRDTTGIRNLTLRGLSGTLPAIQAGILYRIPTGGAFVSLDPGWGPADQRTWVINRSCYVQNVTTFGTAAIGQKVDGALHNGGNRSIVSNDFTQVISDGIGAWMTNGGRGELVSVFSYYAHIGMFSSNGGIIRATNGNSSYGDFGAVAVGVDQSEEVKFAELNTRTEQAIVSSAFAGEVDDFILALEFGNSGQEYTSASYSFTSSGTGAVAAQEEYRDGGMFVAQVLSGGAGFAQYGNQAQSGTTTSITLATAESVTQADIIGMRVVIISGAGTGQYGYVYAYDAISKICEIYRESNNLPGWDHINPGTPLRETLTTGSRYRIEPRIQFNEPDFIAQQHVHGIPAAWASAAYGETSQTFNNVSSTLGTGNTIEVIPAVATFTVIKQGRTYAVTLASGGAGYQVGNEVVILGGSVGGIDTEHDIIITVSTISNDSTNSILTFSISNTPIAASGKFILTPLSGSTTRYSSNGQTWSAGELPSIQAWNSVAAGNKTFVTVANSSNAAATSTTGVSWTATTLPSTQAWNSVVYGKPSNLLTGIFVAVAGTANAGAFSTNGVTWTATTLPNAPDSTVSEWVDIAYGRNIFVALSNSGNYVAVGIYNSNTNNITWTLQIIDNSTNKSWQSISYGNRRFVAVSTTGDVAYSFDGNSWLPAVMPTQDGSTAHFWKQIRYGQGVFFAVGNTGQRIVGNDVTVGPSTFAATSYDGLVWTNRELVSEQEWGVVAFGNPDITLGDSTASTSTPMWIVAPTITNTFINRVFAGAKTIGRVVVDTGSVSSIKIWEPGSGYISPQTATITQPNTTIVPVVRTRIANRVLAQPTFVQSGSAYKTSTTTVTVLGDGFADITPRAVLLTLDGIINMPRPGAQFYIGGRPAFFVAVVVGINQQQITSGPYAGTIRATFRVSPNPTLAMFLEHGMQVEIREKYSQVRITGHDFLDVGTGNFETTNYPGLYTDYQFNRAPEQEVQNSNGGRVFYTSSDQDGNFRAGVQFAVEQATGTVTISADFFDLKGLTELRLSGLLVGSTAVIREFSKEPLFLQNSNNIIPTQRAIRAYLGSRLNLGGADLLTPSIIAGTVLVGPNLISSTAGTTIDIPVVVDFSGAQAGISGSMLAQTMFYRSFRQS